jgi:hypothetical protein
VFTARYALSSYIKQIRFVFKGLITFYQAMTHSELFLRNAVRPPLDSHLYFSVSLFQDKDRHMFRLTPYLFYAFKVSLITQFLRLHVYTVEPGYSDISLYNTSSIASDILWYQLIPPL